MQDLPDAFEGLDPEAARRLAAIRARSRAEPAWEERQWLRGRPVICEDGRWHVRPAREAGARPRPAARTRRSPVRTRRTRSTARGPSRSSDDGPSSDEAPLARDSGCFAVPAYGEHDALPVAGGLLLELVAGDGRDLCVAIEDDDARALAQDILGAVGGRHAVVHAPTRNLDERRRR